MAINLLCCTVQDVDAMNCIIAESKHTHIVQKRLLRLYWWASTSHRNAVMMADCHSLSAMHNSVGFVHQWCGGVSRSSTPIKNPHIILIDLWGIRNAALLCMNKIYHMIGMACKALLHDLRHTLPFPPIDSSITIDHDQSHIGQSARINRLSEFPNHWPFMIAVPPINNSSSILFCLHPHTIGR